MLDLALNRDAETTLRQHLSRLQAQHVSDGAILVLDNRSGDVLALVGSANYFAPAAGQVNGAWAPRSPGSTFKPFTYLLALERGAQDGSNDGPLTLALSPLEGERGNRRLSFGKRRFRARRGILQQALGRSGTQQEINEMRSLEYPAGSRQVQGFLDRPPELGFRQPTCLPHLAQDPLLPLHGSVEVRMGIQTGRGLGQRG